MSTINLTDLISSTFIGDTGEIGPGVANGGVTDQALIKVSNADFDTTWFTLDTDFILEGNTNLYYTDTRVRNALSVTGDLTYNANTGEFSVTTYKSADFTTDFGLKTTDDLIEGNTNLYWIEAPSDGEQYVRQDASWVVVNIPEGYGNSDVITLLGSGVNTDIIPSLDITYDLGSANNRWRDLYLSGNTIILGEAQIKADETTGTISIIPPVTVANPNPKAMVFNAEGRMRSIDTDGGLLQSQSLELVANTADDTFESITVTGHVNANTFVGDGSEVTNVNAATLSGNTVSDLQSYSDSVGSTAYSNAVSYADSVGSTAYSNATSYADAAVSNLVDTAPTTLDTLNELAAALGDDPNFATTITELIGTKLNTSTWTGSAASGITATQVTNWDTAYGWGNHATEGYLTAVSWNDILSKPSTFTPSAHTHAWSDITSGVPAFATRWPSWSEVTSKPSFLSTSDDSEQTIGVGVINWNEGSVKINSDPRNNEPGYDGDLSMIHWWSTTAAGATYGRVGHALYNGSAYQYLHTRSGQNHLYINNNKIWNAGNDGSGSGLDADLLDGQHGSAYQRQIDEYIVNIGSPNASSGTWATGDSDDWGTPRIGTYASRYNDGTGYLQFNVPSGMDTAYISQLTWSSGGYVDVYGIQSDGGAVFLRRINTRQSVENSNEGSGGGNNNQHDGSTITLAATGLSTFTAIRLQNRSGRFHLTGMSFTSAKLQGSEGTGMVHPAQLCVSGSGSGLDADLLDGQQGSYYQPASSAITTSNIGSQSVNYAASAGNADTLDGVHVNTLRTVSNDQYIGGAGWYTIAYNSGNRASARFHIRDTQSSRHQSVHFYASHMYGNGNAINIVHSNVYSTSPIRLIRIKEGGTYDGALLQVYFDTTSVFRTFMYENDQNSGWVLLSTPVADGSSSGISVSNFNALTNTGAQVDVDKSIRGGFIGTGNLYMDGNITAYSDRRVKKNLEIIPDAINKVKSVNGYTFDRTDHLKDEGRKTGLVAQEVLEILPEAVIGDDIGGYALDYGCMVGLLVEAIKEQQTTIDTQNERINKLENALEKLL